MAKDRHRPGYSVEYVRDTYDQLNLRVRKEERLRERVQVASEKHKVSPTRYMVDAILARLEADE